MIKLHATRHAQLRARQRIGWHHRSLERMLERVFYAGLSADECGDVLHDYLDSRQLDGALLPRIYGEHLFLFNRAAADEVVLLTVYRLPSEFKILSRRARADGNALAA
jgi:hypothetical protein